MEYVFAMYHLTSHLKSKQINITRSIGEMLHTFFKTAAERKLCSFSHAILRRSPTGSTKCGNGKSAPNLLACAAGVRRRRKEERRAREARGEDRTREDRGRGRLQGRYCFLYSPSN